MFDIKQFSADISRRGVVKTSNFYMTMFSPLGMTSTSRNMTMRIKAVDIPGRSAQTVGHSHYGPSYHIATGSVFTELNVNILLSEDHSEKEYFEKWMDLILGDYRNATHNYDVGFYDDYKGGATITTVSDTGTILNSVKLIDCFPTAISNVNMDWESGNSLVILPITLNFHQYEDGNRIY